MKLSKQDLAAAVKAGVITTDQADHLWAFCLHRQSDQPQFRLSHVLYYLGGLVAISAVSVFVTNAWENLRGGWLLLITFLFFILGISLTEYFKKKSLRIPMGILATFSLALIPLAVYNLQVLLGYEPDLPIRFSNLHTLINWYWVTIEFSTIIAGLILFYIYRAPFLLFPISLVLWYMSMDLYPYIFNQPYAMANPDYTANFSLGFGLIMLAITILIDFFSHDDHDYAFWLYIFSVMTVWGGLTAHESNSELSKFIYCIINVIFIFTGTLLDRRVFAVFGVIGILFYLGHLAFNVFANSLAFPIVLALMGIAIIFIALFYARMESKFKKALLPYMPSKIAKRLKP